MTLRVLLYPITNRLKFILAFDFEMSNFYEIISVSVLNLAISFKTAIDVNMKDYDLLSIHSSPDPWKVVAFPPGKKSNNPQPKRT